MTVKAQRVLDAALRLPTRVRADIAGHLLQSLDGPSAAGTAEAWEREIERRVREIQTGEVALIPWSRARRELRQRVGAAKRR
jgi:putative addiction module component (TIGR02574 family)